MYNMVASYYILFSMYLTSNSYSTLLYYLLKVLYVVYSSGYVFIYFFYMCVCVCKNIWVTFNLPASTYSIVLTQRYKVLIETTF